MVCMWFVCGNFDVFPNSLLFFLQHRYNTMTMSIETGAWYSKWSPTVLYFVCEVDRGKHSSKVRSSYISKLFL